MKSSSRTLVLELFLLAALAFLAYAPSLNIGLIADDYPNISQARTWGAPADLSTLLGDAQFRLRSTSYWAMYALWMTAGVTPVVYHAASLLLHVLNCWLLLAAGRAWPAMRAGAFYAAAFFAVHEGHQEAVMWFSAVNELLMFLFGAAALACWLKRREAASAALFALALLSKESALILLPLLVFAAPGRWKRLWPHAVLCALAIASIAASRSYSFRFGDGSFSLSAPFWITWPQSFARILWIWGWPALALILFAAPRGPRRAAGIALAWIGIALLPYSFLAYSTRIPSRQTYLASAGLAWLFGLAAAQWRDAWPLRRGLLNAVLALALAHNTVYLWTRKAAQFRERAAPTDQLVALARRTRAPIRVECFPLPPLVAEEAVRLAADRPPSTLQWTAAAGEGRSDAVRFCYHSR
ncbi:MAG TPA: hypothetical protein VMH28_19150 [Candidatus Acidoferrales bacterium]|nr:hypothetical protein [Candidatus Acidoferrales bacterium]